jgi:hypothetical protein
MFVCTEGLAMPYRYVMLIALATLLSSCGRNAPNTTVNSKMEGPDIKSLSHDQLISIYKECTQYGRIDDPRVKYTVSYCAAIQGAQLSAGYTAPGTTKVDPEITKMH